MAKIKNQYSLWIIISLFLSLIINSSCNKKNHDIDENNQLSYKIKNKKYNYPYYESSGSGFLSSYRSINAIRYSNSLVIEANYTRFSHNKLHIYIIDVFEKESGKEYDLMDIDVRDIEMKHYKGIIDNDYIVDKTKPGYIYFSHISDKSIEGTFAFHMVKIDEDNPKGINTRDRFQIKDGKFKIVTK